jgi:predicted nucleic acid-binding protein
MPPKVTDASALAAVAFGEPEAPAKAALLEGHDLVASAILPYELANTAWKKIHRDRFPRTEIEPRLVEVLSLPVQLVPVDHAAAFDLALETGLSAYDAGYLWIVETFGLELASLDGRLLEVYQRRHPPRGSR